MMTALKTLWQSPRWMACVFGVGFALLYALTAAPDVQAGDSAEFQLAAVIGGVPHPTTYPLYTVLSSAVVHLWPFGTAAWRVTLLSVVCGASMVALSSLLCTHLSGSRSAGAITALALGFTPGIWNAATIAEVYALLLLLMTALGWALWHFVVNPRPRMLALVALLTTLGSLYHGLFALCATPVALVVIMWSWRTHGWRWPLTMLLVAIGVGVVPHSYPLIQFARFGPFDGQDYGLPRAYFWGAPQRWSEVFDLMSGGAVRRGIFAVPDWTSATTMSLAMARRMLYEFGPVGIGVGVIGGFALARRRRLLWGISLLVGGPSFAYVLALGTGIGDWPAFTLPMLLSWGIWMGAGIHVLIGRAEQWALGRWPWPALLTTALVLLTVAWGGYRLRATDKHQLTLYREFATAVHAELPRDAVVITHWEQGMTLQYLRFAEGRRPDVWIDVVEPGDDPWLARAERRYPDRPVYFVGHPESVQGITVTTVIDLPYADLYRLER